MLLDAGRRLGAYEIAALLGSGGMGEVYLARDTRFSRDVAIKVLPDLFMQDRGGTCWPGPAGHDFPESGLSRKPADFAR